ncbi:Ogr/Delta-like zinc finger [Halopseudomonas litoralis]|uniref:Ogr/Delta-like zinc finger n=1 Tax=Halopseudomonas litoralis TaxID=797277 RepID=A0A1H1SKP8_9GAMM|nr:ogr/Delta-like zinc finger family protein [Halopseudomonas litoralis]SDS48413.1 Ogr/Delta-like zinc finger [Halopseudomonas litoralis]
MSTYKLVCPHCRSKVRIRTSEGVHIFLRDTYLQCTNEVCSWSCYARFEMTYELSPSSMPNPAAVLPPAPSRVRREAMPPSEEEQLDLLDDEELTDESI